MLTVFITCITKYSEDDLIVYTPAEDFNFLTFATEQNAQLQYEEEEEDEEFMQEINEKIRQLKEEFPGELQQASLRFLRLTHCWY